MSFESRVEGQFLDDFFLRPTVEEVERDYLFPEEFKKNYAPSIVPKFDGGKLTNYFTGVFSSYIDLAGRPISNHVSDRLVNLARRYAVSDLSYQRNDPLRVANRSRLYALIRHPEFIADPSSLSVMEELANLNNAYPWAFNMYTYFGFTDGTRDFGDRDNEKAAYHLREGFGLDQVYGFGRLVGSERLWTGQSGELRREFFSSVGEALKHLAVKLPQETLEPRIVLIDNSLKHGDHAEIKFDTVYSFRTRAERDYLLERIEQGQSSDPNSMLAKRLEEILQGRYEGVLWAI